MTEQSSYRRILLFSLFVGGAILVLRTWPNLVSFFQLPNLSQVECIGGGSSSHLVVYFHGMDSKEVSGQELRNRQVLERIAKKHHFRVALPRAPVACPNHTGALCWLWEEWNRDVLTKRIRGAIDYGRQACGPNAQHIGLLGFSNGGLLVNRVVQQCLDIERDWLISVGAPGSWGAELDNLEDCGELIIMMGLSDEASRPSAMELRAHLQRRNASLQWVDYEGGHLLDEASLEEELAKTIKRRGWSR